MSRLDGPGDTPGPILPLKRRRKSVHRCVVALACALLLPVAARAEPAQPSPVRIVGVMPFGFNESTPHAMAVDSVLHRGYYVTRVPSSTMWVYDLAHLTRIAHVAGDIPGGTFSVDEAHHRIFYAPTQPPATCAAAVINVFDEQTLAFAEKQLPCDSLTGAAFFARGISYYAPSNKLYVTGEPAAEAIAEAPVAGGMVREQTIIRQLDADTLRTDWEMDLSLPCDSSTNAPSAPAPVIGRSPRGVISYCYSAGQGRAVWIPMRGDAPDPSSAEPAIVSPTVGRVTTPVVDTASGRVLILEDNAPFGPAVWIYDPEHQRFAGVVPSGVAPEHDGTFYDYWRGLDRQRGRLYLLNRGGLVAADIRSDAVPAGASYPVLAGGVNQILSGPISIDGGLRRLFFAYPNRRGFVVVQDDIAPPSVQMTDPDADTADVSELAGVTGRTFGSAAAAFGVHLINTGGIPRVIDNFDPACTAQSADFNDRDQFGRCPAGRAVTPGNRESYVAPTGLEAGGTGVVASAGIETSADSDTATDHDVRDAGRCEAARLQDAGVATAIPCPNGTGEPLEPFTAGTRGGDGKGYPIRQAECTDFAGSPAGDEYTAATGSATASCDHAANRSEAAGDATAFRTAIGPLAVTVAGASSSVRTSLEADGTVTVATSAVRGVDLGGIVSIGAITSTARTVAHGRTGTSHADYAVTFAGVDAPGFTCAICDARSVAAAINKAIGAKFRAHVPEPQTFASPRGFQAVVTKAPGLAASDRAVNDDDSVTVNALDLVYYNDSAPTNRDGSAGRSRVVMGLAGVQAESRYGIFVLPGATAGARRTDARTPDRRPSIGFTRPVGPPVARRPALVPPQHPSAIRSGTQVPAKGFGFVFTRRDFGLLFALFSLFAFPLYLGLRRARLRRML